MAVLDKKTSQTSPISPDALEEYAGKWIAVRNGEVVGAADSFIELKADPEVRETDAFYRVPPSATYFY